jgi:hypothetical protein
MTVHFILAVEDALSEHVATKLLESRGLDVAVPMVLKGSGNLKKRVSALNSSAKGMPILLLTDLDNLDVCPAALIKSWLGSTPQNSGLFFRIAVVEVESWLLADAHAIANYLGIREGLIPKQPDMVGDPKQALVNLARKSSRRNLREDLVPIAGSTARVGRAYNPAMIRFVSEHWSADRAAASSPSLARASARLAEYEKSISSAS